MAGQGWAKFFMSPGFMARLGGKSSTYFLYVVIKTRLYFTQIVYHYSLNITLMLKVVSHKLGFAYRDVIHFWGGARRFVLRK